MMRPLLSFLLCGAAAASALGAPTIVSAQELPAPALTPLPEVAPTHPAPEPAVAKPEPGPVEAKPTPELPSPTTVAPVIVSTEEKDNKVGAKLGTVAVGALGGLAGAAVAGPVGKFAGGFVGKTIARGLFGDKDKIPEVTAIDARTVAAQSVETAGQPAAATPATAAPPLER